MKSTFASAVLSAATLVNAASIPHGHVHSHIRRSAVEKRSPIQFMSLADITRLDSVEGFGGATAQPTDPLSKQGVKIGLNIAADKNSAAPVTVGGDGPFKVEFINESEDDIILVSWSNCGKAQPWEAANVQTSQPDVTHTLQANTSTVISFDPTKVESGSISGAWAAIYPDTILNNGFVYEPWGEYTFTKMSVFSTTDVSRITNMNGHKMAIHNFAREGDATPACSSTWERCSFVCPDKNQKFCRDGAIIQNCPVGTPGTTSSADYAHGGCGGMRDDGGYMRAHFY